MTSDHWMPLASTLLVAEILIFLNFTMKYFKIRCQSILANDVSWISSVVFSRQDKKVGEPFLSGHSCSISPGHLKTSLKGTRADGVISLSILEISATKKLHYFHKAKGTLSEAASVHNSPLPIAPTPPRSRWQVAKGKILPLSHLLFLPLTTFGFL